MEYFDEISPENTKGATKIGFDTCFLYNILTKNIDIDWLKESFFPNNSIFYYFHTVERELKNLLMRKIGLDKREKNKLWDYLTEAFTMRLVQWSKSIEENIAIVDKVNADLAKKRDVQGYPKTLRIGRGDIEIISAFMKERLDRIYTSDDGFYQTCKAMGLNVIKVHYPKYLE